MGTRRPLVTAAKRGPLLFRIHFATFILNVWLCTNVAGAPTNQWIKAGDGSWHEDEWSLGRLPGEGQAVEIVSEGSKTVEVNQGTVQSAPSSLTVQSLVVSNLNTLLLQGDGVLRVTSSEEDSTGLRLSQGGTLVNLGMDLRVGETNRSFMTIQGGRLLQGGGSVSARTIYLVSSGEYRLTNGVFKADYLDFPYSGLFAQYGGVSFFGGSRLLYSTNLLVDGEMHVESSLFVSDSSLFVQSGGTNRVQNLGVGPNASGGGRYELSGGLLTTSNTFVGAFLSSSEMHQSGGVHIITNGLRLQGSSRYYPPQHSPGRYHLSGGTFSAGQIELDSTFGRAEYIQSGGSASIAGAIIFNRSATNNLDYNRGLLRLEGGTLSVESIEHSAAGADIVQTGSALIVSNLLSFGGFIPPPYDYGSQTRRIARYDFTGGTLSAEGIQLTGEWIIGSSDVTNRISNPGTFTMAGTLRVGNADETLGRFSLSSNAVIDLGIGNAKLAFANSSSESWNPEAILIITNWAGSLAGNGNDQIRFGNGFSGLSAEQLNQIRFVNPAGLPSGVEYPARMNESGEILPPGPLTASMILQYNPSSAMLSWPVNYRLQSSTNVAGPYEDVRDQNSPYRIDYSEAEQEFFRLRLSE